MQHYKLKRYSAALDARRYFVFSVVRNPFSRAISQIAYLERTCHHGRALFRGDWKTKLMTLAAAKCWIAGHDLSATQADFLELPSEIQPPVFIARFESLDQDWRTICEVLGFEGYIELPHIFRTENVRPFQTYYDNESREAITFKYRVDLERLCYSFDEGSNTIPLHR
jgi:hypothetical protein